MPKVNLWAPPTHAQVSMPHTCAYTNIRRRLFQIHHLLSGILWNQFNKDKVCGHKGLILTCCCLSETLQKIKPCNKGQEYELTVHMEASGYLCLRNRQGCNLSPLPFYSAGYTPWFNWSNSLCKHGEVFISVERCRCDRW